MIKSRRRGRWPNLVSRRDFLNGILASSTLLAPLARGDGKGPRPVAASDRTDAFELCHAFLEGRGLPQADAGGRLHECIVVGGGMAGLVAAWKLQRRGVRDIVVLERNDDLGGLCRSDLVGGVTCARASAYASFPFNREMADLFLDLGLVANGPGLKTLTGVPQFELQAPYDRLFVDGHWVREPFGKEGLARLPVSRQVRKDLAALVDRLQELWDWEDARGRSAFDCPVEAASPAEEMRRLDALTVGEYATSRGWGLDMVRLLDPVLRSAYGIGHERISAWAALDLLSDEWLPTPPGRGALCHPGGNAFITSRLAQRIDAQALTTGAFVTRVAQRNAEVHVGVLRGGEPTTLRARAVVFAAPPFLAPHLVPDLPPERRKAADALEYAPYLVANVAVSRTPAGLAYSNLLAGDCFVSDFIVADWAGSPSPATAPPDRPNVLTAYAPLERAQRARLLAAPFDEWQAAILNDLDRCLPGIGETVTGLHLYRWGHAFAVPRRGWVFSPQRQLLKQPLGRIVFAGADVEGIPTVDHAMASGFRAAEEVLQVLS